MKILLLLSESWNDIQYPNNNMTNWLAGFPGVEIWTVSGSGQMPCNDVCKDYFLLSEPVMVKSIFSGNAVGKAMHLEEYPRFAPVADDVRQTSKLPSNELARLAREFVWRFGRYDMDALRQFIKDCDPDIVFSQRLGSVKMCRMEQLVASATNAPMVAYTGDDEYSLRQLSLSPFYWLRRLWTRAALKKRIPRYQLFYSQAQRQMAEFEAEFGVKTKFLVKCGQFDQEKVHKTLHAPISIVYAGKLYCNRWKTLAMLADAIREVNQRRGTAVFALHIYTRDSLTKKQRRALHDGENVLFHGPVAGDRLPEIYRAADIALHVEAFDRKNRLTTQDSFSTKVMDCLSSGGAAMVVAWEGHAAYQYCKEHDIAITAASRRELLERLEAMAEDGSIVLAYARRAFAFGCEHHQRQQVQKQLRSDFLEIIASN